MSADSRGGRRRNHLLLGALCLMSGTLPVVQASQQPSTAPTYAIQQLTTGPKHHFFGYNGHVRTIPWNQSGKYILALETPFQDHMPTTTDAATIILIEAATGVITPLTQTRAWNFQQGTFLYWNPLNPENEFIFNDRDVATNKMKAVMYDISTRTRREFFFPSAPLGNGGLAQQGGKYCGVNFGRAERIRPTVGYVGAYDWTVGDPHPANDGLWKVDLSTGQPTLLVSFQRLYDLLKDRWPALSQPPTGKYNQIYTNHTLWNRDDSRINFNASWFQDSAPWLVSVNFTVKPDGSELREIGDVGHCDWELGQRIVGSQLVGGVPKCVLFDSVSKSVVQVIGDGFFRGDGELGLSPDTNWIASTESLAGKSSDPAGYPSRRVILFSRQGNVGLKLPWYNLGNYYGRTDWGGTSLAKYMDLRVDMPPRWNRDGSKVLFESISGDGTRQLYVVHMSWAGAPKPPTGSITQPSTDGTTVARGSTLSFAGTVSDADTSTVNVKWYLDRIGDGLVSVLLKDANQAPGPTTGSVLMSGTRTNTNGEAVDVGVAGGQYTLHLVVSDGVSSLDVARSFVLGQGGLSVTINSVSTGKPYSLGTAQPGALEYIDRSYTIQSLSPALSGGILIRTANDDKTVTTNPHLKFTVSAPAKVYVVWDSRVLGLPSWLNDGTWTATTESYTDGGSSWKVYSKSVPAGQVSLGGNLASPAVAPAGGALSNHVVIVK